MAINDYTYSIPKSTGRRLVIPDIHGCAKTLQALLKKVSLKKSDQLFFLGDYIDRGPDSKGVIDEVIWLDEAGYQVFPLRGNHEQMLLDAVVSLDGDLLEPHLESNNAQMLNTKKGLQTKYFNFLTNLPHYFELDTCFLVHAGFNINAWNPFIDAYSMIWIRDFEYQTKPFKGKRIYHGHTPIPMAFIKSAIDEHHPTVNLDNGCVFTNNYEGLGTLICLDIDNNKLYEQPNIEQAISA